MPIYEFYCKKHGKFEEYFTHFKNSSTHECPKCKTACEQIMSRCRHIIHGWSPDQERKRERHWQQDIQTSREPIRAPLKELRDMAREEEKAKGLKKGAIVPLQPGEVNDEGTMEMCKLRGSNRKDLGGVEYKRLTKKGLEEHQKMVDYKASRKFKESYDSGKKKLKPLKRAHK